MRAASGLPVLDDDGAISSHISKRHSTQLNHHADPKPQAERRALERNAACIENLGVLAQAVADGYF